MDSAELPSASDSDVLLNRLRAGDMGPLDDIYRTHRDDFLRWAVRHHPELDVEDMRDAFQEAMMRFYENVISGRLQTLTSGVHSYIFRIADHQVHRLYRKKKLEGRLNIWPASGIKDKDDPDTLSPLPASHLDSLISSDDLSDPFADDDSLLADAAQRGLRMLSPECRSLLIRYYYYQSSYQVLAEEFQHSDPDTTRVRKSQCLARLRMFCQKLIS